MSLHTWRLCALWCALSAISAATLVAIITEPVPRVIFLVWGLAGAFGFGYLLAVREYNAARADDTGWLPLSDDEPEPGPPCTGPCCSPRPPLGDVFRESLQPPRRFAGDVCGHTHNPTTTEKG